MSADTMIFFLNHCNARERLAFRIAHQCAPVLKRIKASNLLVLQPGGLQNVRKVIRGSRVLCVPLYLGREREVLFLYRYDLLKKHLEKREVKQFLRYFGYERTTVSAVLLRLRQRYDMYEHMGGPFPHELGVALEYPVEDVEGFIQNQGRDFLISGYWKVYHNQDQARAMFGRYDQARETALREVMKGHSIERIAAS